ncbi:MAG: hypothetical protein IID32_00030 [Planctomycetes bacterium]|nr:hypothetical protein [Planctomycetota bacterium]
MRRSNYFRIITGILFLSVPAAALAEGPNLSTPDGGLTAGYNKHFFIASDDGAFMMQFYAKLQTRYIYNHAEQPSGTDEDESGFQQRRTELYWAGHVFDSNLTYKVKLAANRGTGGFSIDDAVICYKFDNGWKLHGGQFKVPFLREFLVSSGRQQSIERSYVNHIFNVNRSQGFQVSHQDENLNLALMLHDGANSKNRDFHSDRTDFGIAARGEWLVSGNWKQFKDFASWPDDEVGVMVGGAIDWEKGEGGSGTDQPDVLEYTADVSAEFGGWNLFAAIVGQHISGNDSSALPDADQLGLVVQGGMFVIPEKLDIFARFEHLELDDVLYDNRTGNFTAVSDDSVDIVNIGMNYYFKHHASKLSFDVVWVLDPLPDNDTGAGLLSSPEDDQVSFRMQYQLMF